MATFEEARACPKCSVPGQVGRSRSIAKSRDQLVTITCVNERCTWYNTNWTVQRRPDGSVPDPDPRGHIKEFPKTTPSGVVQANMQDLQDLLDAQKKEGGTEIRRR
jgi:hypothetical protein